jgi:DNA-binding Lrp family transcriptional regulator
MEKGRMVRSVDDTDFRLLQAMGFIPYLPDLPPADALKPSRLAKRIGLGVKATKERIARLEAEGVIAGYDAFPNLRHFPLEWKSFHFRIPEERKPAFVETAQSVDGVVSRFEFVGRDVCVDLCYQDDAEMARRLKLLVSLAGGVAPWEFYENHRPPVARALTPLDWRIVRALRHDAKRPFADLARELRVSQRTVKDRFDRMAREGSLWVVPRIDLGRIQGFIPFGLLVFVRPDAQRGALRSVRAALAPDALYTWTPPAAELGALGAFLRARSMAELEQTRLRAAGLAGVERVEVLMPTAVHATSAWLDEAVARRAAPSETGRAAPGNGSPAAPVARKGAPRERQARQP